MRCSNKPDTSNIYTFFGEYVRQWKPRWHIYTCSAVCTQTYFRSSPYERNSLYEFSFSQHHTFLRQHMQFHNDVRKICRQFTSNRTMRVKYMSDKCLAFAAPHCNCERGDTCAIRAWWHTMDALLTGLHSRNVNDNRKADYKPLLG